MEIKNVIYMTLSQLSMRRGIYLSRQIPGMRPSKVTCTRPQVLRSHCSGKALVYLRRQKETPILPMTKDRCLLELYFQLHLDFSKENCLTNF